VGKQRVSSSARTLALGALAVTLSAAAALLVFKPANPPAAPGDTVGGTAEDFRVAPADVGAPAARARPARDAAASDADVNEPKEPVGEQASSRPSELTLQGVQLPPPLLDAERTFAAEPIDPRWASTAEARILGEIATLPGRSMLALQVECRSTLCRLQVVEPDKPLLDTRGPSTGIPADVVALGNSIRELVSRSGLESRGAMSVPDPSGTRVLVAYFAREAPPADGNARTEARQSARTRPTDAPASDKLSPPRPILR
jgi:hypothetical protein